MLGPRADSTYWSDYATNWGAAQAPASQALVGNMRGFVAEAAVPRFVSKQGTVNGFRRWDILDKMINLDD